jgi:hypothetical protein
MVAKYHGGDVRSCSRQASFSYGSYCSRELVIVQPLIARRMTGSGYQWRVGQLLWLISSRSASILLLKARTVRSEEARLHLEDATPKTE